MGFIYPRTITISRPGAQTGEGMLGYGGETQAAETQVATSVPASIQERREGQRNPTGLPGDGTRPTYYIFIPKRALARDGMKALDVITDDLGVRYKVVAPYWDSLGHRPTCELLEP